MSTGPSQDPPALRDDEALLEPFDWYREMRADAPVRFDPDRRSWDVFRHDDVRTVFADPGTFSSDLTGPRDGDGDDGGSPLADTVISTDPPEHGRLRSAVDAAFGPGAVADLEPEIRTLAADLVETFGPDGECDFVADFAEPLPAAVVAELLGVPAADRDRFADWSATVVEVHQGPSVGGDDRDVTGTMAEMTAYFGDALAERREAPRDDLLTLVAGVGDGPTLGVREMLGFCMLLMIGGTITVGALLTNVLRCLADRPDLLSACERGEEPLDGVVEETLRYRSPLQALARRAVEPATLRGHDVEPGETVVCWLGSANRDGRRFDEPAAFRPERSPNPHLALGHGPHFCLGASLARLETRVALEAFFERVTGVDVDARDRTPVRSETVSLHGVESLPVSFEWSP